jgi:hypothetical protein
MGTARFVPQVMITKAFVTVARASGCWYWGLHQEAGNESSRWIGKCYAVSAEYKQEVHLTIRTAGFGFGGRMRVYRTLAQSSARSSASGSREDWRNGHQSPRRPRDQHCRERVAQFFDNQARRTCAIHKDSRPLDDDTGVKPFIAIGFRNHGLLVLAEALGSEGLPGPTRMGDILYGVTVPLRVGRPKS